MEYRAFLKSGTAGLPLGKLDLIEKEEKIRSGHLRYMGCTLRNRTPCRFCRYGIGPGVWNDGCWLMEVAL